MVNWAEGLKTLGEGLGRIGAVRVQKEENELEAMRREALEKLRQKYETERDAQTQKFQTDLFEKGKEADAALAKQRDDAEAAREKAREAAAGARHRESLSAAEKADVRQAVERANSELTRQLSSISGSREAAMLKMSEFTNELDPNPEGAAQLQEYIKQLDAQERVIRQGHALEVRRIQSGDYGKPVSADEVKRLLGAKPENPPAELMPPAQPTVQPPAQPAAKPAAQPRPALGSDIPQVGSVPMPALGGSVPGQDELMPAPSEVYRQFRLGQG